MNQMDEWMFGYCITANGGIDMKLSTIDPMLFP